MNLQQLMRLTNKKVYYYVMMTTCIPSKCISPVNFTIFSDSFGLNMKKAAW